MNTKADNLSAYQCRPRYQPEVSTTSGCMSRGANGTRDSDGTNRWLFSRLLISATSMMYLPAFRSASTRFTVSVALPVETSTFTPNFFEKTSTTGRYCREGAPPDAIESVPSCFAAALSFDHSSSKLLDGCPAAAWAAPNRSASAAISQAIVNEALGILRMIFTI